MFERFTTGARDVVRRAWAEAEDLRHQRVGTEHLLLGLLATNGVAREVLQGAGVDPARVRADIERLVNAPRPILTDEEADALRGIGIDVDTVLARVAESLGPEVLNPPPPEEGRGFFRRRFSRGGSRFAPRSKKVLELSLREAIHLGDRHIGTEHILLGLIREGQGLAARILTDAGVDLATLRQATLAARKNAA